MEKDKKEGVKEGGWVGCVAPLRSGEDENDCRETVEDASSSVSPTLPLSHFVSICMYVSLLPLFFPSSLSLPLSLSVCPLVSLFLFLSGSPFSSFPNVALSSLFISRYIYLSVSGSVAMTFMYLSLCLAMSVCLSFCLYVCLSLSL